MGIREALTAPLAQSASAVTANDPHIEVVSVSLDEARAKAAFHIVVPRFQQPQSMALVRVDLVTAVASGMRHVHMVTLQYHDEGRRWLVLQQSTQGGEGNQLAVPGAQRGRVGAHDAIYFSYTVPARELPTGQRTIARCRWLQGDILLDLQAPDLSTADLALIAASVA